MSGEKIDLYVVCRSAEMLPKHWHQRANTLALVTLARAAMRFSKSGHVEDRMALDAALSPFTDSAEVRSDGE